MIHIKNVFKNYSLPNIKVDRLDWLTSTGIIHSEIWQKIIEADLIFVDITGYNPNVMFELGVVSAWKEGWFPNPVKKKNRITKMEALNFEEQRIVDLCKKRGSITNKHVQDLLGVHRNTATRKLKEMALRQLFHKKFVFDSCQRHQKKGGN